MSINNIREGDIKSSTLALLEADSVEQIRDIMAKLDEIDPLKLDEAKLEAGRQACLQKGIERIRKESLKEIKRGENLLRKRNPVFKIQRFALIVASFILLTGLIAYATGTNLTKLIVNFGNNNKQINFQQGIVDNAGDTPFVNINDIEYAVFDSIDDALKNISFNPNIPAYVPNDLELFEVSVKQADLETRMSIFYQGSEDFLHITITKYHEYKNADRMYDYNGDDYELVDELDINGADVLILSDGTSYHAIWVDMDVLYRVYANKDLDDVMEILKSFK